MTERLARTTPRRSDPAPATGRVRTGTAITGGVSAIVFVAIFLLVLSDGLAPLAMDVAWHDAVTARRDGALVAIAQAVSLVGGTLWMVVIPVVVIAVLVWRRRPWSGLELGAAIVVVVAIGAPLSYVVARPRPDDSLAETIATSFPSGHTAVATTFCFTLVLLLRRWYVAVAGATWVLVMAWARTFLAAHWLSDVVAGFFEGVAVTLLVWALIETIRALRAARARVIA